MALTYVTITGTFDGGDGSPLTGSAVFTPNVTVYASGAPVVTVDTTVQAEIVAGQLQSLSGGALRLLATDNSGLTFEDLTGFFFWTVQVTAGGEVQEPWSFFLPSSPSSVDLYALAHTPA